jgi:glycosyltransferase involved in cell wall biosynthesis
LRAGIPVSRQGRNPPNSPLPCAVVRVALVHDWLTGMRGGERALDELCALFPDADLYTLVHVPGSTSKRIENRKVFASPLSRLPGAAQHYRKLLPLFPWAIQHFRLQDYELVLSSSHAVAKGVRPPPGAVHLCYCFTPMRYVWDQADAYLGRGLRRALARPLLSYLRSFDVRTSGADHVHRFVAISRCVADRIARHYRRDASVVYPPVDIDRLRPDGRPPDDFYLLVGGFVPYKREDLALQAFRRLSGRLLVAGDGPTRAALAARAPSNVTFLGRVTDTELSRLYARCRGLIYPQEEDFGIVAVEAQACGRPVIALGRGGALETVVPLGTRQSASAAPTGIVFEPQSAEGLAQAVERFEREERAFDPQAIRAHAEGFAADRFRAEIRKEVELAFATNPPTE